MKKEEKEGLLKELDKRAKLWELTKGDAERRLKHGIYMTNAKIDLQVAEDALERIRLRKEEIVGVPRFVVSHPKVTYPKPAKKGKKDEEPEVEEGIPLVVVKEKGTALNMGESV